MSLEHVADLSAVAGLTVATSIGDRAVTRLRDQTMPPAPLPRPNAEAIDAFAKWVDDGMLPGSCNVIPSAGPADTGPAATSCTSGRKWPVVWDTPSVNMNPGLACISCHKVQNPTRAYFFMGTVYPTLHEEDRCYSKVPSGTRVEILDASGDVAATFSVFAKGNFHSPALQAQVTLPFTARIVTPDGKARQMMTPQMNGDCNSCHTEQGRNGAPGRILLPH